MMKDYLKAKKEFELSWWDKHIIDQMTPLDLARLVESSKKELGEDFQLQKFMENFTSEKIVQCSAEGFESDMLPTEDCIINYTCPECQRRPLQGYRFL